ncbi:MAG: hypothetical protein ACRDTG_21105, partial [Pseudonocardiaceae bacterium]
NQLGEAEVLLDLGGSARLSSRARIATYSWDDRGAEQGKDQPVKVGDDGCDSARYGIATTEQIWRPYLRAA